MSIEKGTAYKTFRPHFFGTQDEPWIRSLLDEYQRFEGQTTREWQQRLRQPFSFYCPQQKLRLILKAFAELFPVESLYPKKKIRELRKEIFLQKRIFDLEDHQNILKRREALLQSLTCHLLTLKGQRGDCFESLVFADLAAEKRLAKIPSPIPMSELLLCANTYLVKSIMQQSQRVDIKLRGKLRPIVRQAGLRGLICVPRSLSGDHDYDATLSLSGPLGLFRHTKLYGRLLTEIVPFLPNCDRFSLQAYVPEGEQVKIWSIQSGDPIKPAKTLTFDSKIEQRFACDFGKLTQDYDLIREPQAVAAGSRLIFPDFAIKHRTNSQKTWLLEIVGYWTQSYLQKKIANLHQAKIKNLIICVAKNLGTRDEWPMSAQLLVFDRWIDPSEVLKLMHSHTEPRAIIF